MKRGSSVVEEEKKETDILSDIDFTEITKLDPSLSTLNINF